MELSRQEYWSRLPFPSPGVLPSPGIEPASPVSPALQADSLSSELPYWHAAAAAKSLQSCPTLCDPRDGSPPGSPVPGILQARTLEWVAISFSNAWKEKEKSKWSCSVMSDSMQPHGLQPARLLCPWGFPSKNTGVGCHFLLQGIFPTQGSNPGLPHCRQTLYHLSHQGSPLVLGLCQNVLFVKWICIFWKFKMDLIHLNVRWGILHWAFKSWKSYG